ncbi:microtubule-associated protein futsch-like [Aplysia californica]|uniref:Microtubule-associated protein futsch-like n=1 Tax=Aplysia californica TaxID=6500 RepID=A0ABM1W501_APLCA|nr:microtubule-associated protein futsch-like [Aplysia californica]
MAFRDPQGFSSAPKNDPQAQSTSPFSSPLPTSPMVPSQNPDFITSGKSAGCGERNIQEDTHSKPAHTHTHRHGEPGPRAHRAAWKPEALSDFLGVPYQDTATSARCAQERETTDWRHQRTEHAGVRRYQQQQRDGNKGRSAYHSTKMGLSSLEDDTRAQESETTFTSVNQDLHHPPPPHPHYHSHSHRVESEVGRFDRTSPNSGAFERANLSVLVGNGGPYRSHQYHRSYSTPGGLDLHEKRVPVDRQIEADPASRCSSELHESTSANAYATIAELERRSSARVEAALDDVSSNNAKDGSPIVIILCDKNSLPPHVDAAQVRSMIQCSDVEPSVRYMDNSVKTSQVDESSNLVQLLLSSSQPVNRAPRNETSTSDQQMLKLPVGSGSKELAKTANVPQRKGDGVAENNTSKPQDKGLSKYAKQPNSLSGNTDQHDVAAVTPKGDRRSLSNNKSLSNKGNTNQTPSYMFPLVAKSSRNILENPEPRTQTERQRSEDHMTQGQPLLNHDSAQKAMNLAQREIGTNSSSVRAREYSSENSPREDRRRERDTPVRNTHSSRQKPRSTENSPGQEMRRPYFNLNPAAESNFHVHNSRHRTPQSIPNIVLPHSTTDGNDTFLSFGDISAVSSPSPSPRLVRVARANNPFLIEAEPARFTAEKTRRRSAPAMRDERSPLGSPRLGKPPFDRSTSGGDVIGHDRDYHRLLVASLGKYLTRSLSYEPRDHVLNLPQGTAHRLERSLRQAADSSDPEQELHQDESALRATKTLGSVREDMRQAATTNIALPESKTSTPTSISNNNNKNNNNNTPYGADHHPSISRTPTIPRIVLPAEEEEEEEEDSEEIDDRSDTVSALSSQSPSPRLRRVARANNPFLIEADPVRFKPEKTRRSSAPAMRAERSPFGSPVMRGKQLMSRSTSGGTIGHSRDDNRLLSGTLDRHLSRSWSSEFYDYLLTARDVGREIDNDSLNKIINDRYNALFSGRFADLSAELAMERHSSPVNLSPRLVKRRDAHKTSRKLSPDLGSSSQSSSSSRASPADSREVEDTHVDTSKIANSNTHVEPSKIANSNTHVETPKIANSNTHIEREQPTSANSTTNVEPSTTANSNTNVEQSTTANSKSGQPSQTTHESTDSKADDETERDVSPTESISRARQKLREDRDNGGKPKTNDSSRTRHVDNNKTIGQSKTEETGAQVHSTLTGKSQRQDLTSGLDGLDVSQNGGRIRSKSGRREGTYELPTQLHANPSAKAYGDFLKVPSLRLDIRKAYIPPKHPTSASNTSKQTGKLEQQSDIKESSEPSVSGMESVLQRLHVDSTKKLQENKNSSPLRAKQTSSLPARPPLPSLPPLSPLPPSLALSNSPVVKDKYGSSDYAPGSLSGATGGRSSEGNTRGDAVGNREGDRECDTRGDVKDNTVGDREGDTRADAESDREGNREGDREGDAEGNREGDREGDTRGDTVGKREGNTRGDAKGDRVGDREGYTVSDTVGDREGDTVSDTEGDTVSDTEGGTVSVREGDREGNTDGSTRGDAKGDAKGDREGNTEGNLNKRKVDDKSAHSSLLVKSGTDSNGLKMKPGKLRANHLYIPKVVDSQSALKITFNKLNPSAFLSTSAGREMKKAYESKPTAEAVGHKFRTPNLKPPAGEEKQLIPTIRSENHIGTEENSPTETLVTWPQSSSTSAVTKENHYGEQMRLDHRNNSHSGESGALSSHRKDPETVAFTRDKRGIEMFPPPSIDKALDSENLLHINDKFESMPPRNDKSKNKLPRNDKSEDMPHINDKSEKRLHKSNKSEQQRNDKSENMLRRNLHRNDKSESMPPRNDKSENMLHRNDKSESMPPRNDKAENMLHRNDKSENMLHRNDKSENMLHRNDKSENMLHRNDKSENMLHRNDKSENMLYRSSNSSRGEKQNLPRHFQSSSNGESEKQKDESENGPRNTTSAFRPQLTKQNSGNFQVSDV